MLDHIKRFGLAILGIAIAMIFGFPFTRVYATEFTMDAFPDIFPWNNLITSLEGGAEYDLSSLDSSDPTQAAQDFVNLFSVENVGAVFTIGNQMYNDDMVAYQNYILNDLQNLRIPWRNSSFISSINYDILWYQKLSDELNIEIDDPIENVPSQYLPYINTINGEGFWWKNYDNINLRSSSLPGLIYYPSSSTSWFSRNQIPSTLTNNIVYVFTTPIKTVNIVSYNDTYSFYITVNDLLNNFSWSTTNIVSAGYIQNGGFSPSGSAYSDPIQYTGTLEGCLNYLAQYCRNVNITVDGVPWSVIGLNNDILVGFPDVIGGNNWDDTAYDVVVPVNNDLAFDITALWTLIKDQIANNDVLNWDTLIDGDVVVDGTGESIKGREGDITKEVPVAKTIDDAITGEFDDSITPTPDPRDPDLFPVIPALDLPVIQGLGGSTILSEIIDATQTALPSKVTDTFWGIVFIMFIIGIIWIFHK